MALKMPQHLLLGLPVVLGVCLRLSFAARAASWEDELRQGLAKADSNRDSWGDFFSELGIFLWTLDVLWFLVAATIALVIGFWQPSQIVGDASQVGSDGVKWTPPSWYTLTTIFASLQSHAAGILGFVGFQKIVVARIVSTSQPRANWSAPNFLLLTSIAISITAIFSSLVFMGVDYLRRLAIDSARSRGYRLIFMHGKLERTGLGMALIIMTVVLIVLYMLVIYSETQTQNSKKQEAFPDLAVNHSRVMKVLMDKACSCATVLIYFFNLRSLCESPKVHFHQNVASAGEELERINTKDYLTKFCSRRDERSNVRSYLAYLAYGLAGEDIGLLVKMGTRRALFPNQRLAPLLNVVGIVMLFGMVPGILQFATERLFVDPQILEVRAISAYLLPAFDAESKRKQYVLLLDKDPSLHVKTRAAQTSSIQICCENTKNCTDYPLQHSLIQFDETPAILKIPAAASTKCNLTARGLSKKSSTTLDLNVEVKTVKYVCGCLEHNCSCCDGYEGGLDAEAEEVENMLAKDFCTPVPCDIDNSNREPGPLCNCSNGYVGDIVWEGANVSGNCTPAPCYIENSTRDLGLQCQCRDGFSGEVQWHQSLASGECLPADCGIPHSVGMGPDCKCMDGYDGNITWNGSQASGACAPAAGCAENVENSAGEGAQCKCRDGFTGNVLWQGAVPHGSCKAAECRIENSNQQRGPGCRCKDGYVGDIRWHGDRPSGTCTPAPCAIKNSNRQRGQECACLDGFAGKITWKGQTPQGPCQPASCANIANATGNGTECKCKDGFDGAVTWSGANASGDCEPAPCRIANSNEEPGPACKCLEGFEGRIGWKGPYHLGSCHHMRCLGTHSNRKRGLECGCMDGFEINGSRAASVVLGVRVFEIKCVPAPCRLEHSNRQPGKACRCADGYYGDLTWKGQFPSGTCTAAHCDLPNSNLKPGLECKCLDAFSGQITWMGEQPEGRCWPAQCNISNSNHKPGKGCKCLDGFVGEIVWKDDVPSGSCKPAPCNIPNSNLEPGPACRCKDGFQGNITWDGPSASGACEPVPCRVLHSDLAPGPACQCAGGFFGRIVWSGSTVSGTCVPRPLCGFGQAVHVTRLTADLVDADGNTCKAGQAMLVHGVHKTTRLRWTSAEALPPAKCKVEWPDVGPPKNPDPQHFSLTSWCAKTPGKPLCSSQIVYTLTSRYTSNYACDGCRTSEHALTEFRGRRCGYDLVKWESLTISPGSPNACTCNLSLSCSEVPSEELPKSCMHFVEPAVLSSPPHLSYIFYESGDFRRAVTRTFPFDVADGVAAAPTADSWLSDGENILVTSLKLGTSRCLGRPDGSFWMETGQNTGKVLRADTVLPEWWRAKFKQDEALPGSFNTDRLAGCEVLVKSNNLCYSARLGQAVWVTSAQGDCVFQDDAAAANIAYEYKSSAFGLQTYRSNRTCYPTAAFEEILVEVVDVGMPTKDFNYTVASSPCRTMIRYMVDARSKLSECRSFFTNSARQW
ncbi:TNC [Symbiodinium sp. CCMP2456]|nr:TNC [Symbiodinium sp. CCMP2456]